MNFLYKSVSDLDPVGSVSFHEPEPETDSFHEPSPETDPGSQKSEKIIENSLTNQPKS